ncbi:MAG: hypothetical protein ACWA5A_10440 [Marinibacterium sp.]
MTRHVFTGAVLAALAMLAGPGRAADLIDRGYFNGWQVMVDPDLGNGCLIQAVRGGDTLVRIGRDGLKDQGYLAVFNPDWTRIREGQDYDLIFDLDGRQYPATVTGLRFNRIPGAGVTFDNPNAYSEVARSKVMTVLSGAGKPLLTIDLKGTAEAIGEARKCQKEMG